MSQPPEPMFWCAAARCLRQTILLPLCGRSKLRPRRLVQWLFPETYRRKDGIHLASVPEGALVFSREEEAHVRACRTGLHLP